METTRRFAIGPWVLTALCAAALGCGPPAPTDPGDARSERHGGTLVIDSPQLSEVRSLDPVLAGDINSSTIADALYEGLLGYSPEAPGELVPVLASSWERSDDGTVWTFHLRDGVRFHDDPCFAEGRGREMTVEDVRLSLARTIRRDARAGPFSLAALVEGAAPFSRGEIDSISGLEIVGDGVLRVTLLRASNAFPHALATAAAAVVPREAIERYGDNFGRHPVGTGPFRLAGWNTHGLVLVRNASYWKRDPSGTALPYLDSIVLKRAQFAWQGMRAASNLLEGDVHVVYFTGEADWMDYDRTSEFLEARGVRSVRTAKYNTIFHGWNLADDTVWAENPTLRRAVQWSLEVPESQHLLVPASGLLPPSMPGCGADGEAPRQNLRRARELLAEAGFPGGRGLPPLHVGVLSDTSPVVQSTLESLAKIGVETRVTVSPRDVHWQGLRRGDFGFFRDGWIADYPDPENFFWLFYSESPVNHTRYSDPEYDRLFERLRTTAPGDPERPAICARLEQILQRDAPAIFLYHERSLYLIRPEVRGFESSVNPLERKFYEFVWLDRGSDP